tara:strand:- start:332 stop:520 length:189 start_codon:yes stop_codon:yes gene_type:complete
MKTFEIYWYDNEKQLPTFESGYFLIIKADSEIDALRKTHYYVNTQLNTFFRESTYHAQNILK